MIGVTRNSTNSQSSLVSSDYGLLAQNISPAGITLSTALPTSGTVYVMKMRAATPITVTNICMFVTGALSSGTSGQNFAALYDSGKSLLAQTTDQTTPWASTGSVTMPLSASKVVNAGVFYIAVWANATTRPSFRSGATGTASINGVQSAANAVWASADTSVTTTAPPSLGTFTAFTSAIWAGVS